jgi:hypothetical protein
VQLQLVDSHFRLRKIKVKLDLIKWKIGGYRLKKSNFLWQCQKICPQIEFRIQQYKIQKTFHDLKTNVDKRDLADKAEHYRNFDEADFSYITRPSKTGMQKETKKVYQQTTA